ncbi:hypothetical protein D3C83_131980 [compost metagenome]
MNAGLSTPLVPATASAEVGYQVAAAIGRLSLNQNSWPHWPPQCGPTSQLLVPAKLKYVALPLVSGSFGELLVVAL